MMNFEESREDMQRLGTKIQTCREAVEQKLSTWDSVQRQAFFDEFSNSSVLAQLNEIGPDPVARLQLFLTMPDSDLEKIMTLQACIIKDAQEGGTLGTQVNQMATGGGKSPNQSSNSVLGGLISSLGSLSGLGGHDHSHSHAHSHSHDHSHDDHGDSRSRKGVPVTSGVETMER